MKKASRSLTPSNVGKSPRIERKFIEKNRRIKMKNLYSQLTSLLPQRTSESKVEGAPLPDQIDEAVEHIKSMKARLEKLRQKKEFLLQRNQQPNNSCITNDQIQASNQRQRSSSSLSSSPLVEVHDMGPNLDVIIANGLQNYSNFRHAVRLVHQNGVEIASASFARDGNSSIQALHDKVGQPKPRFDGPTIARKLRELGCGGGCSSSEVVESQLNLWDYEIDSNINWGFDIPEVLLPGLQEFMINMNKS